MRTERELIFRTMDLEFTYEKCLNNLKKDELIEIRRSFQLANVSKLKKSELVEVLNKNVEEINEEYIAENLIYNAYNILIRIIENFEKGNENFMVYEEDMVGVVLNLKEVGFAFPGIIDKNIKAIVVPKDILPIIKKIITSKYTKDYMTQRRKYTVLIAAYIHYYGIINQLDLNKIIEKSFEFKDLTDDANYNTTLMLENEYGKDFRFDFPYVYHTKVENSTSTLKDQIVRKELDYYPLTSKLFEEYQENKFNFYGDKLYTALIKKYSVEEEKARELVWEFIYDTQNSLIFSKTFETLSSQINFHSLDEANELMKLVNEVNNNLRLWILKGNTPIEVREKFEKKSNYGFTNRRTQSAIKPIKKDKKIGRNKPCPCGSGKKYKKCCGAN